MDLKTSLIYLFVIPGVIFSLLLIVAESFLPAWIMLMIGCLVGVLLCIAATSTLPNFSAKGTAEQPATETATTEPTTRKRGIIFPRGSPEEFWLVLILTIASGSGAIYLHYFH